jgi:hypothetical protein
MERLLKITNISSKLGLLGFSLFGIVVADTQPNPNFDMHKLNQLCCQMRELSEKANEIAMMIGDNNTHQKLKDLQDGINIVLDHLKQPNCFDKPDKNLPARYSRTMVKQIHDTLCTVSEDVKRLLVET